MILLDVNVLLFAYNEGVPQHRAASDWLKALLASDETIVLPWVTIWAFLRISTNAGIHAKPKSAAEAFSIVRDWLSQPKVVTLEPGPRHLEILERIVVKFGVAGPLMTDAVLAALALEHGATVVSTDHDFRRFPDVSWVNPLAPIRE